MTAVKSGIVIGAASWLLGMFFVHWSVDHNILWSRPFNVQSIQAAYEHYNDMNSTVPQWPIYVVSLCLLLGIGASIAQIAEGGPSIMFDSASLFLFLVMTAVWSMYEIPDKSLLVATPLDNDIINQAIDKTSIESILQAATSASASTSVELLKKLASSHTMIAVSLTGVITLQAGRYYSLSE